MITPLESALITTCATLATGILVNRYAGRDKVDCADCAMRHQTLDAKMRGIEAKDHADHAMMLRMLRSIVVNLDIPDEKKEAILNDTRARGE